MLNDKDPLDQTPMNEEAQPAMDLPEIPASTPAVDTAPVLLYDPPKAERKGKSSGWRIFAAAVALVTLSTGIGSGTTYYLMKQNSPQNQTVGYDLLQSNSLKAVAQSTAEAGASVIPAIYKQVAPSVVAIYVSSGQGFYQAQGSGSGFVVDAQGYILTNYHVIEQANKIQVKFVDGTALPATVVGTHKTHDLAVLKVDPGNRTLVAAKLGDSEQVDVGELAVAIGNPYGQEFTVTAGIVSALDREITEQGNPISIPGAIQTDAAINPGNSGGPLLNASGEVIGINTAIESPSSVTGNVGLGFAVPVNLAKEVLPQLMAGQSVKRAFLGVSMRDMDAQAARLLGIDVREGALVWEVQKGSAAEAAGLQSATFDDQDLLKTADVITAVNGTTIKSSSDLANAIARQKVGDSIALTVIRGNETLTLKATLGAAETN